MKYISLKQKSIASKVIYCLNQKYQTGKRKPNPLIARRFWWPETKARNHLNFVLQLRSASYWSTEALRTEANEMLAEV
jgi:hypothetical protein